MVKAEDIKAIVAQTEGDGYSRGYAMLAFLVLLLERLYIGKQEVFDTIPMI